MYTPTRPPSAISRRELSSAGPRKPSHSNIGRSKSSLGDRNVTPGRFPQRQIPMSIPSITSSTSRLTNRSQCGSRTVSRQSSQSSLSGRRVSSSSLSTIYADGSIDPNNNINNNNNNVRIQVAVRPRPLSERARDCPWQLSSEKSEIISDELGVFHYDHVFSPNDEDDKIYDIVAAPVIRDCLNGFSGTIFAYGMTGSGKTHSMKGLVEKSISTLFNTQHVQSVMTTPVKSKENWMLNSDVFTDSDGDSTTYKVNHINVSILEIYNEKIIDLLNTEKPSTLTSTTSATFINNGRKSSLLSSRSASDQRSNYKDDLRIVDDPKFGVKVLGLKEVKTTNIEDLRDLITLGESLRRVDTTDFNERSSRSHLIVQLKVALVDKNETNNDNKKEIVSCLNFCDLAGSERSTTRTDRRKEGGYINKSLLALGTVITKLSQLSQNSSTDSLSISHIPYRDSKLTRLLQPSLSGGSIVSILCTIHLGSNVIGETTNTLRFGLRAKNVLLNVKRNEREVNRDVLSLLKENESLLEELSALRLFVDNSTSVMSPFSDNVNVYSPVSSYGGGPEGMDIRGSLMDERYHEVVAENKVLSEQIEHLKRLQEGRDESGIQSTDLNIQLLSQQINTLADVSTRGRFDVIVESLKNDLFEERHKSNEMASYISHLENRVRLLEIELDSLNQTDDLTLASSRKLGTDQNLTLKVVTADLEETIKDLRVTLERKDAMITALQSANRLQNVVSKAMN